MVAWQRAYAPTSDRVADASICIIDNCRIYMFDSSPPDARRICTIISLRVCGKTCTWCWPSVPSAMVFAPGSASFLRSSTAAPLIGFASGRLTRFWLWPRNFSISRASRRRRVRTACASAQSSTTIRAVCPRSSAMNCDALITSRPRATLSSLRPTNPHCLKSEQRCALGAQPSRTLRHHHHTIEML